MADLFINSRVRLRSHHGKYLYAGEDRESVTQDRNGLSENAWWTVDRTSHRATFYYDNGHGFDSNMTTIRLKSCYGRYLTASDSLSLFGMTGRKVIQQSSSHDSSVDWEPIRGGQQGNRVKLKIHGDRFLRANGSAPPWRNSITHDKPYRTSSQDLILWEVVV